MPEIQNELHLSGSQPDIERLISSIMTPSYQMIDFARILPVPDELASLPAGMSRVKIDCYLTAVNPNTADYRLEKLPAETWRVIRKFSAPGYRKMSPRASMQAYVLTSKAVALRIFSLPVTITSQGSVMR